MVSLGSIPNFRGRVEMLPCQGCVEVPRRGALIAHRTSAHDGQSRRAICDDNFGHLDTLYGFRDGEVVESRLAARHGRSCDAHRVVSTRCILGTVSLLMSRATSMATWAQYAQGSRSQHPLAFSV